MVYVFCDAIEASVLMRGGVLLVVSATTPRRATWWWYGSRLQARWGSA